MKKKTKRTFKDFKKFISGLHKTIGYVSRRTGYLRLYILFDIIRCHFLYGSTYDEYRIYEFYLVNMRYENTYLTTVRHNKLMPYLVKSDNLEIFKDRREFYKKFDKFLKRDTCYSKNLSFKQSEEMIKKSKKVVCKTDTLKEEKSQVLDLNDYRSAAYLLEDANKSKLYILEEFINQHPWLDEINPNGLNILSIVTLKYKEEAHVIAATMKFGTSETYEYDYKKSDYICGYVNLNTGIIEHECRSRNGMIFTRHPVSKIKMTDILIPNFEKATKAAIKCASIMDDALEVEWNFAISKSNVHLMSANLWTDYTFSQIPDYLSQKIGLMPYYRSHVDKSKKL